MYVMKKYFILGIILFSGLTCSAAVYLGTRIPVLGQTISDKKVQGSIVSYVYAKVSRETDVAEICNLLILRLQNSRQM